MLIRFSMSAAFLAAIAGSGTADPVPAAAQPRVTAAQGATLAQAGPLRRIKRGQAERQPAAPAKVETFTAAKIRELRSAAEKAVAVPDKLPEGWSKSKVDPRKLVAVFAPLQVKQGVVLRAYQFKAGGNGNGVVWALPAEAAFPEPDQCPKVKLPGRFMQMPRPPAALDSVMGQMESDGSAWSYLAASLLGREIVEFGAMWHGTSWGTHRVLDDVPWKLGNPADPAGGPMGRPHTKQQEWRWLEPEPKDWRPKVVVTDNKVTVTFYTYSGYRKEAIYRHTDTYTRGNYRYQSDRKAIAEGKPGFVF